MKLILHTMKKLFLSAILFMAFQFSNAQVANSAEEISPLLIGEKIPETTITTANRETTTKKLFKQKPSVVVVYRGGWCPYCNKQLMGMQDIEADLLGLGYQILAVSPDAITEDGKKYSKNYTLVSDNTTKLIQNLGIAFKAPTKYEDMLSKASGGKNNSALPAPAVFIVDKKGKILFEYISPDYKNRIDEKLLLAVAKAVK